jgi:Pyruvate/2-oxoacid:ferredoxin oxidoreductase gamma subunit
MFLNTYMLGALSSFLEIKESSWLEAIKAKLKKDTEENKRIFLLGRGEAER